jgi:hypothetical protein
MNPIRIFQRISILISCILLFFVVFFICKVFSVIPEIASPNVISFDYNSFTVDVARILFLSVLAFVVNIILIFLIFLKKS